jgi:glycine C-acetyltransferase
MGRVDLLTGTLGKALGGASGGYVSGRRSSVALLRQRSRPYLFSNSVAPVVAAGSLEALRLLESTTELIDRLRSNTAFFRARIEAAGLQVLPGEHPIVPIMIGDAGRTARIAQAALDLGIYVIGFSYPVVPVDTARIRTQVSAAHTEEELSSAVAALAEASAATA